MDFTYSSYLNLLNLLRENNYSFSNYGDWLVESRTVILRHDIDETISKAVEMAELEYASGVKSTYFVLVTSNLYNALSKESLDGMHSILELGHEIGLHFDEARYSDCADNLQNICAHIAKEAEILGTCLGKKVNTVSMHRPSKGLLEADISIPGMINSYSSTFFRQFKYLSDSRMRWREPVEEIVRARRSEKLHILTHPFWYSATEQSMHDVISRFVKQGNENRYDCLNSNITDLNSIMAKEEALQI